MRIAWAGQAGVAVREGVALPLSREGPAPPEALRLIFSVFLRIELQHRRKTQDGMSGKDVLDLASGCRWVRLGPPAWVGEASTRNTKYETMKCKGWAGARPVY